MENVLKNLSLELLKITALSAAISAGFVPLAQAADQQTLDTVMVTANRNPVPVDQTLASVTVLTRADIEKSQAPDLADLLTRQAGIDMTRTGGPGSQNSLFLRGSNSNHALVLIDGIRVNSATQGLFDFAHLPLSQIDRIEIGRCGVFQLYQRALFVTLVDGRTMPLFVGVSAVQAEFMNGGLQRWLTSAD